MDKLTHGSLLARNTIWNLIGYGVPLVVALFAIPLLIKGLGTDRFGVLTLAWVFIGYLSLFDLGLGRALKRLSPDPWIGKLKKRSSSVRKYELCKALNE